MGGLLFPIWIALVIVLPASWLLITTAIIALLFLIFIFVQICIKDGKKTLESDHQ